MLQKKKLFKTVPVIFLGVLLFCSAYRQLHTPMTPPPITTLTSNILPTTGNIRALVVVVDFADVKYNADKRLSDEALSTYLFGTDNTSFYPCESLTNYFSRASYGALHMTGNVFHYTAKGTIASYETTDDGYETLVREVLSGLNDTINYTDYDSDDDGYIDALCLSVPKGGNADFWYGCTASWYASPLPDLDGEKLNFYVISDEQPYADTMDYYLGTLAHEYGHCMGLPDYYKYGLSENFEATTGDAGLERMDESEGDFCPLSKLLLGWYTPASVQIYQPSDKKSDRLFSSLSSSDRNTSGYNNTSAHSNTSIHNNTSAQTFTLTDDTQEGSCLIIPRADHSGYFSEYMIIDYITPNGNYDTLFSSGGLRIYHVDTTLASDEYGSFYLASDNYSPVYDSTNNGKRVLRLVNDGNGFFCDKDVIDDTITGFGWYDENGQVTVNTGYTITVDSVSADQKICTVTVLPDK